MALIKCPDCGSNISDSAEQCIYCGCDLFLHKEELRMDEEIEIKVSEYEQRMKKPEQVKSLSEIHQYRNENNANTIMLLIVIATFVASFFCFVAGMDAFYGIIMLIGGIAFLALYISMSRNSRKLLKEEQSRRQNIIDNFKEIKEIRVRQYRELLIAEKQKKLEEIKNRNNQQQVDRPVGLRCPACGSMRYDKISTLNRVVSVELVGLASSKIGKQYKCKKCGHLW